MSADLYTAISVISLVLTVAGILGGIFAFRNGFSRTANEVQERVINALNCELDALRQRINDLERENSRFQQIISTICEALKKRGLAVSIDGNLVSISDGKDTHSMRIQEIDAGADTWRP